MATNKSDNSIFMNFNLISWLYKNDSKEEILNFGLKIYRDTYLDSKATFLKLKRRYPGTPIKTIEVYVQECEKANIYGTDLIQSAAAATGETQKNSLINNKKLKQQFDKQIREGFPWVNKSNLSSLYKWTCYGLLFDD